MSSIEETVKQWFEVKDAMSKLEKKNKIYRTRIEKYMDANGLSQFTADNLRVKRTTQSRQFITRKDIPREVWRKYSKDSVFYVYTLSKK